MQRARSPDLERKLFTSITLSRQTDNPLVLIWGNKELREMSHEGLKGNEEFIQNYVDAINVQANSTMKVCRCNIISENTTSTSS